MEPNLCVKGCGFFGSAENRNMCSKCYKDFLKTEEKKPIPAVHRGPGSSSSEASEVTEKLDELTVKTTKMRCKSCNKKVGLLGFHCRCGGLFCSRHRIPELHSCEFDYKASNRSNGNPHLELVKGDKLDHRV